jgi:hypothetical protein
VQPVVGELPEGHPEVYLRNGDEAGQVRGVDGHPGIDGRGDAAESGLALDGHDYGFLFQKVKRQHEVAEELGNGVRPDGATLYAAAEEDLAREGLDLQQEVFHFDVEGVMVGDVCQQAHLQSVRGEVPEVHTQIQVRDLEQGREHHGHGRLDGDPGVQTAHARL